MDCIGGNGGRLGGRDDRNLGITRTLHLARGFLGLLAGAGRRLRIPFGNLGRLLVRGGGECGRNGLRERLGRLEHAADGLVGRLGFDIGIGLGGYLATKYLLDRGHRRIACMVNTASNTGCARLNGYVRVVADRAIGREAPGLRNVHRLLNGSLQI